MTVIKLPDYPASAGPAIARRIDTKRDSYRKQAAQLRAELEKVEEAWAKAFDRHDVRTTARDRVAALAKMVPGRNRYEMGVSE